MCNVEPDKLREYWGERWNHDVTFEQDNLSEFFKLNEVWDKDQGEEILRNLENIDMMENHLKSRGSLSAPGSDEITYSYVSD
jgi:hypothetical protein